MLPHRLAAAICIVAISAVPLRADAPGAPASLSAVVSAQRVSLSWAAPVPGDVAGYIVEAGAASGLANLAIVRVPASSPTFVADGVPAGSYQFVYEPRALVWRAQPPTRWSPSYQGRACRARHLR